MEPTLALLGRARHALGLRRRRLAIHCSIPVRYGREGAICRGVRSRGDERRRWDGGGGIGAPVPRIALGRGPHNLLVRLHPSRTRVRPRRIRGGTRLERRGRGDRGSRVESSGSVRVIAWSSHFARVPRCSAAPLSDFADPRRRSCAVARWTVREESEAVKSRRWAWCGVLAVADDAVALRQAPEQPRAAKERQVVMGAVRKRAEVRQTTRCRPSPRRVALLASRYPCTGVLSASRSLRPLFEPLSQTLSSSFKVNEITRAPYPLY
ncbi:hypothetical protein AAT19DRAFT_10471 [Rhodotorula toruloides]|uniref:Uncharacterized protein n=1 Tax=Rhodotorula toruloides TaxID=5286 RepID=A0A2S9ZYW6_RHOTO|nr:hypothetical protein AAT19DRAFT_10471 [Rhodotorula toruloides]